jgi:curved DNA-binding protein
MQNFRNYYAILDTERDTPPDGIKQAYRKLARQFHPDVNPGDKVAEDRFKEIAEAYEVLSDSERRAQYDKFGSFWKQQGFQQGAKRPWGGWGTTAPKTTEIEEEEDFSQFREFNEFVDTLLNGRSKETPKGRSKNTSRPSEPDDWADDWVPQRRPAQEDPYTMPPRREEPRPQEIGQAQPRDAEASLVVPLERAFAGGKERVRLEDGRSLEIVMPAGMVNGQKVRLRGQGISGGDLYLLIEVPPHPKFRLDGVDVFYQLPITPAEAVLGGPIAVPTISGPVRMNMPNPVRSGQKLRLGKKGFWDGEGDRGDQIIEIVIQLPKELSDQERDLYEKLRQIETNPRGL